MLTVTNFKIYKPDLTFQGEVGEAKQTMMASWLRLSYITCLVLNLNYS